MSTVSPSSQNISQAAQIQCNNCERTLPLRMSLPGESSAMWLCTRCEIPYVAFGNENTLLQYAHTVRLDKHYFDVTHTPEITLEQRQEVAKIANRSVSNDIMQMRRSKRIAQSLVVPAIMLGDGFVPEGKPFKIMVANISREGIGLVHSEHIRSTYIAVELEPLAKRPIQVITKLVRQIPLEGTYYYEIGGEFFTRLGSVATD